MRNIIFGIFFTFNFSLVSASDLKLVIIADTNDGTIGSGVKGNVSQIRSFFIDASKMTGLNYVETVVSGMQFGCQEITDMIENISFNADDVIVFYYSGHGYRNYSDMSLFPRFFCGSEVYTRQDGPGLQSITATLRAKSPRLLIGIADTCNVIIAGPSAPAPAGPVFRNPSRSQAFKNLFLRYSGTLQMSSSAPNQYSWYYPNQGLFTAQLLKSLDKNTSNSGGAWSDVIRDAMIEIVVPTGNPSSPTLVKQNPQAEVNALTVMQ